MDRLERLLRRPAIIAIFPLIAGILCAEEGGIYTPLAPYSLVFAALLLVIAVSIGASRRLTLPLMVIAAFFGGLCRQHWHNALPSDHVANVAVADGKVTILGRVVSHVALYATDLTPLDDTDPLIESSNGFFVVDLSVIEMGGRKTSVTGAVKVNFYRRDSPLRYGDIVSIEGRIKPLRPPTNPGQPDFRKMMLDDGIGATLSVSEKDAMRVIQERSLLHPRNLLEEARSSLRSSLLKCGGGEMGPFLSSLLLGFQEPLSRDLQEDLRRTGTAHFLAISGFHLVLIFAAGWVILTLVGFSGRRQSIALLVFLAIYTLLTGLPVSVVRSFIMIAVYLLADLFWRRRDTMNTLAVSAIVILAADSSQLFSAGFQLSYLAVLGIILLSTPIFRFFGIPENQPDPEAVGKIPLYIHTGAKWLGLSISVSFAAWLATAPLMSDRFNLVTPVIIIANLLMSPLMLVAILGGFLLMIAAAISVALAAPFAALLSPFFSLLQWVADGLAGLPLSSFYIPDTPLTVTLAIYAALIVWTLWCRARPSPARVLPLFLLVLIMPVSIVRQQNPDEHRLTMLDVGDGAALFLEYPDGTTILCDAGSSSYRDVGRSIVAPFLWERGIHHIDTLILTHPDADHTNGVRSLIERFRFGQAILPKGFTETEAGRQIAGMLRRRGIGIVPVEKSPTSAKGIYPGAVILSPPSWDSRQYHPTTNELSLVIKFPFDHDKFLMTGDVEGRAMEVMLADEEADLRATILQAPHHAKKMKGAGDFAKKTFAKILLVSATERGYSADVVGYYEFLTTRICKTSRSGAVTITSKAGKISVTPTIDP